MSLLPHFPLHLNPMAIFGIALLLGLVGGELARRSRFLPLISGYLAMGFLVGPGGFNIVNASVLSTAHIFVEISLSLILFELGKHLDFRWLWRDRGLLFMCLAESGLTFAAIFFVFFLGIHLSWLQSALAATIAMATSPAVVMLVAHDLSAEGPVTRRTLFLTSFNNLLSLIVFTFLLPMTQADTLSPSLQLLHATYRLFGSFILGMIMFAITEGLAYFTGKNKESQFVLFVGMVILTIGLAVALNLSTMLSLIALGLAARNFDPKYLLMEVDFGWLARLFFILLFVVTGVHLQPKGLWGVTGIIFIFIFTRYLAKIIGLGLFAKMSKLTTKQTFALSLALMPMASVAISMSNLLLDFNPNFGHTLLLVITGVVTFFEIFGPIATQWAFISTREAIPSRES